MVTGPDFFANARAEALEASCDEIEELMASAQMINGIVTVGTSVPFEVRDEVRSRYEAAGWDNVRFRECQRDGSFVEFVMAL